MSWRKIVEILAGGLAGFLLGKYASLALYNTAIAPLKVGNAALLPLLVSTLLGLLFCLIPLLVGNGLLLSFLPKIGVWSTGISLVMSVYTLVLVVIAITFGLFGNTSPIPLPFWF
ncbi:hypothetical protein [Acaryochloris sp. IP29b_bin.137]|uniref:hypothetical protein n=1 Tax=Acaryochloris sp. IP29b_bin.137 TaxID=2969217 RepID=UPI002635F4E9|nr:hypothetical protein [Acaryochloris sp. IP29b_bin.137]